METWQTECLLIMWGMGKVCDNVLCHHHLNFVLKVAVIESATNQRELAIWVLFGLVRGELLESLHDKERFGWYRCPESNSEYLLNLSCVPITWNPVTDDHMTVPDGEG